jgi:hypothetical protein
MVAKLVALVLINGSINPYLRKVIPNLFFIERQANCQISMDYISLSIHIYVYAYIFSQTYNTKE